MTDTPDADYLAAVRRCGGKPRPGESQVEFAARVASEAGRRGAPREMPGVAAHDDGEA